MMSFRVNTIELSGMLDNNDMEDMRSVSERIADDPNITGWFTARTTPDLPGVTTATGGTTGLLVTSWANRKTGGAVLSEAVTGAKPAYTAAVAAEASDNGGPNRRGYVSFYQNGSDKLTLSGGTFPVGGDFFKACIFKAGATSVSEHLILSGTANNRHIFGLSNDGKLRMRVGDAAAEANAGIDYPVNTWCLGIGCWDATAKKCSVTVNKAVFQTHINTSAVVDQTGLILSNGSLDSSVNPRAMADVIYGPADLTKPANAATLAMIRLYAKILCGINT